jgi:transcriptional antiterminator NusG
MQIVEQLETAIVPGRFDEGVLQTATETQWFAVQVRSRQEAQVAQQISGKGYEHFLPMRKRRKLWSDRIRESEEPIFPGYLFCRFDPLYRLPILTTPSVIQIVGYNRKPVAVDEAEIRALQTLIASGVANQTCPFLEVGDRVRIESGALRGLEGILVDTRSRRRLILSVSILQRSVAVEIDSELVTRFQ